MASNPTRALFVSSEFGKSAIELCVSWLTPQRQLLKPRLSSHTTAHAVCHGMYRCRHTVSRASPRLHVGELEQLEKDLEKRRAPCCAAAARGVRVVDGVRRRATALRRRHAQRQHRCCRALSFMLWLASCCALRERARARYHSGPWLCCKLHKGP